jgi:hypothetical protein
MKKLLLLLILVVGGYVAFVNYAPINVSKMTASPGAIPAELQGTYAIDKPASVRYMEKQFPNFDQAMANKVRSQIFGAELKFEANTIRSGKDSRSIRITGISAGAVTFEIVGPLTKQQRPVTYTIEVTRRGIWIASEYPVPGVRQFYRKIGENGKSVLISGMP